MGYYERNKEKIKQKSKDYYYQNRDKCIERSSNYSNSNPEKVKEYKRKHKEKRKNFAKEFVRRVKLMYGCLSCGYKENAAALDFHHSGKKASCISRMVTDGYTISRIKDEMRTCIVLCSNCHRKHHSNTIRYNNLKYDFVYDIKNNSSCKNCGENDPKCLDFHHIGAKVAAISAMIRDKTVTIQDLEQEMQKCIILCSNCHRSHHSSICDYMQTRSSQP